MHRVISPRWLVLSSLLLACSGDPTGAGATAEVEDPSGAQDGGVQSRPDGGGDEPDGPELMAIAITPTEVELVSINGSMEEVEFSAIGTYRDGTTRRLEGATFSLESRELGEIGEASGQFVASGRTGGETVVRATASGHGGPLTAQAKLTVNLVRELVAPDLPAGAAEHFASDALPDGARAATIVYPLEGAVMPQNVFPADVQWLVGVQGDQFRVRFEKPHVKVSAIIQHTGAGFGNHYLPRVTDWRALATSDVDEPLVIAVDRWEAASGVLASTPRVRMRFARASLTGSLYYWEIANQDTGRVMRIDDGTDTAVSFMPYPPTALRGEVCVGCHSVSPSGRYMAGRLGGGENIGGIFDLTTDLTGNPPPSLFPLRTSEPTSARWWFSSWSPDETRMIVSTDEDRNRALAMLDPRTGETVTVSGTLPTQATHPAWSPDGTAIAFTANINSWGGTNTEGDIAVMPVSAPDTVGLPSVVHAGRSPMNGVPAGNADSYPTWTPDSARIAFAHGTGSRSQDKDAALYLMKRDGSDLTRLDRAVGGPLVGGNFQPHFSPFEGDGYFWMSFLSRREYGNGEVGTRGKGGLQQIWVAAIKMNPAPGEDASEVAYRVPGQNVTTRNISAYWAPRACRQDGESCSVGSECCGGQCLPDAGGNLVCAPPPPEECRMDGQTCSQDSDCCDGNVCIGNVCTLPIE
jgi:hypothetical protein